jgi:N-acetyltransferase
MAATLIPATWPIPIPTTTLAGSLVSLEPLLPSHIHELTVAGLDAATWQFTTSRADNPALMRTYVDQLLSDCANGLAIAYAVRHRNSKAIVGCTRLKNISRKHRNGIVGSWYSPAAWRTGVNLEAKLLLLGFAFDQLGCVRVEFHTDARNLRSRHSLEQLGASFEGILRAHQITLDGALRDSAIYSILSREWPTVRAAIFTRLQRHANPLAAPSTPEAP